MHHSEHRISFRTICAILLGLVPALCGPGRTAETPLDCRVLQETADGVFVDIGSRSGLKAGDTGWMRHAGAAATRVEVVKVGSGSTFLRVLSDHSPGSFATGSDVTLVFDIDPPDTRTPATRAPSPTMKDQNADRDTFTPLLATPNMGEVAASEASDIFHGRITARQMFQLSDDIDVRDYSITRVMTSGSLERIAATPWTFEWSGQAYYRTGEELEDFRDFEKLRVEAYRLALFRRFEDRSFVRVGRFLPGELPLVGFLDGAQGEKVLSENIRLGGMVGVKPQRVTTSPSLDEPTIVPYITYAPDVGPDASYSGTAGVLFSLYEGDADRLAFLWDQQARIGRLSIFSSSAVDFDVGGAEVRNDIARLTWLTFNLSYPFSPLLRLRAGIDKYELPDTQAERDAIRDGGLILDEFFREDTWRYWVGASHQLPWNLTVSEKGSFTDSRRLDRWRASAEITRLGLPGLPEGTLTLSLYTIQAIATEGYGAHLWAYLPFMGHHLSFQPAVTVRFADYETRGSNFFVPVAEDLWFVDYSLRARWIISENWSVEGGVSYSWPDQRRVLVDLGATFRW